MPPVELKQKYATSTDGSRIYYEVYDTGAQPSVLLIHGIGGDLDAWQYVREPLLKAGVDCIALDLRGHGYSDHPRSLGAYTAQRLCDDVCAVLDREQLPAITLVGHSGGAVLALLFATRYPERVERLVLINGSYTRPRYLDSRTMRFVANMATAIGVRLSPRARGPWHSPYPKGKVHKEIEAYGLVRTLYHNSLRSYLLMSRAYTESQLDHDVSRLAMPTLIIAAENDGIYPLDISKTLHALIPRSQLRVVPNANHVLPLNRPQEVAALILEFLKNKK